jgi:hypothetical protein
MRNASHIIKSLQTDMVGAGLTLAEQRTDLL